MKKQTSKQTRQNQIDSLTAASFGLQESLSSVLLQMWGQKKANALLKRKNAALRARIARLEKCMKRTHTTTRAQSGDCCSKAL